MDITKFNEKLNRIDGKIYVVEEVVTPVGGLYEAELTHDNINNLNVYTGSKLTGTKITTYSTSTPSLTPWKIVIKIFSTEPQLYISYETTGDQVEAEDINNLQDAINLTQEELNNEIDRAKASEKNISDNLNSEITRAKNAESTENTRAINRENVIENNLTAEIKRATDSENNINKNLDAEVNRAKKKEEELNSNINTTNNNLKNETNRATQAEKVLTDNLSSEINRSKGSEKIISDNLSSEVDRAKAKENSIESNLNNYKTSNDSEIQGLKAKDIDLDNKKANLDYVNLELNKRYTKDQTFTREEVLKKIQDLIGTAPDTLDTFKEIADALGNDPNFATTIMNELSSKVDKVTGKSLSTNDYDNTEKTKLADVNAKKHEHSNKSIIDKITQGLLDAWNSAYNHISDSIRHITSSERNLWNTVSDKANKTDIPSKLSQLTNDKKFITQDDIDTSQNHIHNNKPILDKINQQTLDDINLSADKVLQNKLTPIEINTKLTKLDNCAGGYVRNMQIRGKTLQNICKTKGGTIKPNGSLALGLTYMFKQNTIYTLIVNSKANSLDGTIKIVLETPNIYPGVIVNKGEIGLKTFKFQTPNIQTGMSIYTDGSTTGECILDDIMILEGEPKEIPPYFEGIQSTGEIEGNKISILTKGKNLIKNGNGENELGFWIKRGNITFEKFGEFTGNQWTGIDQIIKVKQNTDYTVSCKHSSNSGIYVMGIKSTDGNTLTFNTGNNNQVTVSLQNKIVGSQTVTFAEFQLLESTTATTYETYKEDKTEILLPSPHCGLPSGTADVVDYDKNERTKNVAKLQLETITGWTVTATDVNTPNTIEFQYYYLDGVPDSSLICNNFNIYTADWLWNKDVEGIAYNKSKMIQLRINKAKLESLDDIGLKKWFQTNLTVLYHQLANPITEKLNIKDELQTFTDGYIQLNNAITPCTSLEYSTNLPSALSGVVEIQDKILDRVNILEKKKSLTWDELEGV
ncbi:hypothetical protein [Clostridium botulinum]|uniref:hypothetical protein n=2 Tax=Clostridium botulinum TaxID=1491 RepID=UPI0014004CAD|nr:hypothetical protein [Clostridium botulinum]MBY6915429.1 hypothetical protein [Clostridium botulinum]NFQ37679.1 hypothetical protein [Clostridium botulinum]